MSFFSKKLVLKTTAIFMSASFYMSQSIAESNTSDITPILKKYSTDAMNCMVDVANSEKLIQIPDSADGDKLLENLPSESLITEAKQVGYVNVLYFIPQLVKQVLSAPEEDLVKTLGSVTQQCEYLKELANSSQHKDLKQKMGFNIINAPSFYKTVERNLSDLDTNVALFHHGTNFSYFSLYKRRIECKGSSCYRCICRWRNTILCG